MTQLGVSYIGNRIFEHAKADLQRIAATCDYVVHPVSETDLAFHKLAVSRIFNETRRLGLEVWADPWGLGGVFGGETFSKFLVDHRDSWQVMSDGRVWPSVCLNRPEWHSFVKEWILTVRDLGAQVLFWDEPHVAFTLEAEWAGIFACACDVCKSVYKKKHGEPLPGRLNDQVRAFRRETLREFLNDVMGFAKSKGLRNALCLYAFKGYPEYDLIWEGAADLPDLDIFGSDPYWRWRGKFDPAEHVREFSRKVIQSASRNGKQSQIWIQAMRLARDSEHEIARAVEAAAAEGVTHVAAWSYDGGEITDTVLAERPEVVRRVLEESFAKIRGQRVARR